MKNKSRKQLVSELTPLRERVAKLSKEIIRRDRKSNLGQVKKYVGNYYRDTRHKNSEVYCHVISISGEYFLAGTTLVKYSNKQFCLEFNDSIIPYEDNYDYLKEIPQEEWNKIINELQPEINKGLK